jgi:hypothetical protein
MLQPGSQPHLGEEALDLPCISAVHLMQGFDRHLAADRLIGRCLDLAATPGTQRLADPVARDAAGNAGRRAAMLTRRRLGLSRGHRQGAITWIG